MPTSESDPKKTDTPEDEPIEAEVVEPEGDAVVEEKEEQDVSSSETSTPQGNSTSMIGVAVVAVVAAVLGGVVATYLPFAQEKTPISDNSAQLNQLSARLGELEQNATNAPTQENVDLTPLQNTMSELDTRLEQVSKRVEGISTAAPTTGEMSDEQTAEILSQLMTAQENVDVLRDELNNRLAVLETAGPISSEAPVDLGAALEGYLKAEDIEVLSEGLTSLSETIGQLGARIEALEAQSASVQVERAALTLMLTNFVRAVESGTPFQKELNAVTALAPDLVQDQSVQEFAVTGLIPREQVANQFDRHIDEIFSEKARAESQSWLEEMWANITSLVVIRRRGDVAGDDLEAILARSEQRLAEGDLRAALEETSNLPEYAQSILQDWRRQVEAHLTVEGIASALSTDLLKDLSQAEN